MRMMKRKSKERGVNRFMFKDKYIGILGSIGSILGESPVSQTVVCSIPKLALTQSL